MPKSKRPKNYAEIQTIDRSNRSSSDFGRLVHSNVQISDIYPYSLVKCRNPNCIIRISDANFHLITKRNRSDFGIIVVQTKIATKL